MILSQLQLKNLSETLNGKIPELLHHFSIEFIEHEDRYTFPCHVHKGDNLNGACLYKSTGIFRCWTHSCEADYPKGILAFIQLSLGASRNREVPFPEALEWAYKFLGKNVEKEIPTSESSNDVYRQNRLLEIFNRKPIKDSPVISRDSIIKNLKIPSQYYIDRGFSSEVLIKFDIGECHDPKKPMYNRAVAPVYNIDGKYIGCSGRTICNSNIKWMHSKGFSKSQCLYGINLAYYPIMKKRKVFLVEGPGDVWRMHEAGFGNTVAILGANLSEDQLTILESLTIDELLIFTDNDNAGKCAYEQIIKRCGRRFNYTRLSTTNKDVGETSIEEVKKILFKYA
jgi:5S rRNA maturation endonuclease (ribonuclease M5)